MKSKLGLIVAVCCLWTPAAFAKARFMGVEELVAISDVVAVIEVTRTERIDRNADKGLPTKGNWQYAQKNTFRFAKMLKNEGFIAFEQKKDQVLWAQKSFICARASYAPGKYLVFLESVGTNEWVTLNHQLGGLGIDKNGNVLTFGWYLDPRNDKKAVSLDDAKKTIHKAILDGKAVSFEADIPPGLMYNKWKPDALRQKLWFHVCKSPKQNWPDGLTSFVRAFFKKKTMPMGYYRGIARRGGRYKIKASWVKGYLVIDSIEEKVAWLYQNTTDDDLKAMAVQKDVTSMRVHSWISGAAGPFIMDEGLRSIGDWMHLKRLDLMGLKITDNGLVHIAGLKNLETLSLCGTKVTDKGLRHISGLINLRELWLDFLPITDKGAAHLKGLTKLQVLRFHGAPITDKGFENFHNMLDLEDLQLGKALITNKSMPFIAKMTKLKTLDLRVKVTDKGIRHLSSLTELSWLAMSGTMVGDEGMDTIAKLRKLEWLIMEDSYVTNAGVKKLIGHPALRVLYLSGTDITDAGLESLAALAKLERLKLNRTEITDNGLAKLKVLKHLTDLEIRKTKTTQKGIDALKAALPGLTIRADRKR